MSRRPVLAFLVPVAMLAPAAASGWPRPVVAVFDIETDPTVLKPEDAVRLADIVAARVAESTVFDVVPRSEVCALSNAQAEPCRDDRCRAALGAELSANRTLSTQVSRSAGVCTTTMSLRDVRGAVAPKTSSQAGGCTVDDLLRSTRATVFALSGGPPSGPPTWKDRLEDADILTMLRTNRSEVRACLHRHASRGSKLEGTMTVTMNIRRDGRVEGVDVAPERFAQAEVATCLRDLVRTWRFPSFDGDTMSIDFPVTVRGQPLSRSSRPTGRARP